MQTTLLGLAVAMILALVAALVGPLLIDWGTYRSAFETEATRLLGVEVRVSGPIDARLLPTPELTLRDIEIGTRGSDKMGARSLGIEFALGPLMRGEWRATHLHMVGPKVRLGLDVSGRLQAPNVAIHFDPDALAIERLNVQDGELILADAASGATLTLDKFGFDGEARSLLGPFSGQGNATVAGVTYPFRVALGRYTEGRLKLNFSVDLLRQPLSFEAQGIVNVGSGTPDFDGQISLRRPVGLVVGSAGALSQPWRVGGKVKATSASALVRDFEFDYGSQERGFKLTGVADFKFGKQPRFNGVLSGRQIDVDRALGGNGELASPADAIGKLVQLAGDAFRPSIPIQLGIGIDQVTLGGDTVQSLRGDISTSAQGWNLDRFEFRAPGFTDVRLTGRLTVEENRAVFTGPVEVRANNPMALATWLEGRPIASNGPVKPLGLRGKLMLADNRVAVEELTAAFDRETVTGRFAYAFASGGHPAQLDVALEAPALDIDTVLGFGNEILAGAPIERPHDITLAADIAQATVAGFAARDARARLKVSSSGLQIDRLSVADLGGAAFSASGQIVTAPPAPQGSLQFDLDAPDMTPIMALLSRYAPQTAQIIDRDASTMAPAKLHGTLTVKGVTTAAEAKLAVEGILGKTRLAFDGAIIADLLSFEPRDVQLHGRLSADDGKALLTMLRLDRMIAVSAGPGELTLEGSGSLHGDWRVDGKLKAGGLDASANGTASPFASQPSADLHVAIARADAAPLRRVAAGALPVSLSGRVAVAGEKLSLSDLEATIDGAVLRGKLGLTLLSPHQVQGDIAADRLDGSKLIATMIGIPPAPDSKSSAWRWSDEPFGRGALGDYQGTIKLKAQRLELLPKLTAREFMAILNLGNNEFSLGDMVATVAGGRLTGSLGFHRAGNGLKAHAKIALTGADAAGLLPAAARMPITGTLAISGEAEGAGLSPLALIGSLRGSGKIMLRDAHIAGLDPRAFNAVAQAVDQGLTIDNSHVTQAASKALDNGRLLVRRAEGEIAVGAGQVRLDKFVADSEGARLSIAGNLDLTDGSIKARILLSGLTEQAGARPEIFKALNGPVTGPEHSTDVSALTSWLTLRAVEIQARQLRDIERGSPPVSDRESTPRSAPAAPIKTPPPAPRKKETAATPRSDVALPPKRPAPPAVARASVSSKRNRAPVLPAPVEIGRAPNPVGAAAPESSAIGQQN